jgi:hypothetical protein
MKIKKNGKVITLSESDLRRIVKRVINEGSDNPFEACFKNSMLKVPAACLAADTQSECFEKLGEMIKDLNTGGEVAKIISCIKKKMGGSYPMDEKM